LIAPKVKIFFSLVTPLLRSGIRSLGLHSGFVLVLSDALCLHTLSLLHLRTKSSHLVIAISVGFLLVIPSIKHPLSHVSSFRAGLHSAFFSTHRKRSCPN
jgi:hypothetical protein